MSKLLLAKWASALFLALFAGLSLAGPPEEYRFLPLNEAAKQAEDSGKPMLLYFGRYGCTTCRKMHAEVFTDPLVFDRYSKQFALAYVDTESSNRIQLANGERTTEMQYASRSRILGTPTFVFFSPQQKPLFKKAGFQSIEQMKRYADFIVGGHYAEMTLTDYLAQQ